jgi:hypothetical protein
VQTGSHKAKQASPNQRGSKLLSYTHLIGLGDFAPEGATEISPGASEAQPGVRGL